jgi:hypothetical protein
MNIISFIPYLFMFIRCSELKVKASIKERNFEDICSDADNMINVFKFYDIIKDVLNLGYELMYFTIFWSYARTIWSLSLEWIFFN